ncbi:DUF4198 domain-containing protein [Puniceibacterium sp. IMCC21224]|uniref:DUF4198 domain-containing protein n=1 Tax=Puniceibacterium sp. IMCC21224 TaxID=1618204 RepID=UPI00064D8334|nr:DUF4198 domain-containing protein [Puniceibacterium sp. IMCC21224]KMK68150.1 nickel uptake transporter family protein [Puniceibacterium sp. IMCC21224]
MNFCATVRRVVAAGILLAQALPAAAHEFWISPQNYQVAEAAPLMADLRVGQSMQGSTYAYVPPNFRRFEVAFGDTVLPVEGRAGDKPALNMTVPGDGLAVVVHVTRDYSLTWTEWEKFQSFCEHKDIAWALARHKERGLSENNIGETYSRHAKSLIAVGDGAGADREMGLLTEIVANANPYTDDLSDGFPVQVLYEGKPRADTQIELFAKAPDGTVETAMYRTDAQGRAVLTVLPGYEYLVDSVVMREIEPATQYDAVWESLWASLTFRVPDE